uniref:HORMA domain-containing protein n=2 Tax=Alexandrium monilatum TaxID=311494 RepID=A0A7S4UY76_9DINO
MSDDINDLLVLFLKCFLFTVLKIRGLYPEESFKRQQVLGHLAWWSTCSEVEEYVSGLCESLRPGICRNRLRRVLLPICGAGGALRERYAVELLAEPQRLAAQGIDEVCHALRLALVKLEMSPVLLGPNTGGGAAVQPGQSPSAPLTWAVLVETRAPAVEDAPREEALGPAWDALGDRGRQAAGPPGMIFHPLKSVAGAAAAGGHGPPVVLNVYVEDASRALHPH